jgi:hypothetical protein
MCIYKLYPQGQIIIKTTAKEKINFGIVDIDITKAGCISRLALT